MSPARLLGGSTVPTGSKGVRRDEGAADVSAGALGTVADVESLPLPAAVGVGVAAVPLRT